MKIQFTDQAGDSLLDVTKILNLFLLPAAFFFSAAFFLTISLDRRDTRLTFELRFYWDIKIYIYIIKAPFQQDDVVASTFSTHEQFY